MSHGALDGLGCTETFSIGQKPMKHRKNFILIKNPEKKESLWHVGCSLRTKVISPWNTWGTLGGIMTVVLQTVHCNHLRRSGCKKHLSRGWLFQAIVSWKTCKQYLLLLFCQSKTSLRLLSFKYWLPYWLSSIYPFRPKASKISNPGRSISLKKFQQLVNI